MNKNKLLPVLRFPDFQKDKEWVNKKLGDFGDPLMCKRIFKEETTIEKKGNIPFYKIGTFGKEPDAYIVKEKYEDYKNRFSFPNKGDILISASGTIGRLVVYDGAPAYFQDSNIIWLGHDGKEILNSFLYFAYQTLKWKTSDGGIISRLYNSDFKRMNIAFTDNKEEQQKIASCLSSLEDLIDLHKQRLAVLKKHKKGLMQNLFPKEGETFPAYRFPEFENDGDWAEKKLGDVFTFVRGPFGGALKKESFVKEGFAVYEQSHAIYSNFNDFRYYIDINKFNELIRFSVKPGDMIMSCSGTMGKFSVIPNNSKKGVINQALLKLSAKKNNSIIFLKYLLETELYQNKLLLQSAGGAIKNVVGVSEIKEISIHLPIQKEQQKIAECLSSADELITTQRNKIDQLKAHKKGLIQGLFPKIEE